MPMNVYISEDGEWAFLALNLCVSCLPGCEQRLFTYCTRLAWMLSNMYRGHFECIPIRRCIFMSVFKQTMCLRMRIIFWMRCFIAVQKC